MINRKKYSVSSINSLIESPENLSTKESHSPSESSSSIHEEKFSFNDILYNSNLNKNNYKTFNNNSISKFSQRTIKFTTDYKSNKNLPCFVLEILENEGPIKIIEKENKLFLIKIEKVKIEDNFKELYEKGKEKNNNIKYYKQKKEAGYLPEISFFYKRYYYYSKYDKGIKMDYESWYSVTPESIAKYIALITRGKIIIDGFCGSGGNVIQFSKFGKKVYAIDIDKNKIDICKNNCNVYECENNIEFILDDYLNMKGKIKADFVFLSPPWGGLKYKNSNVYSIKKFMQPNIIDIIRVSLNVAKFILFYVPRNLDLNELIDLVSFVKNEIEINSGNKLSFDVRILYSNQKIKTLLIIFGYDVCDIISDDDIKQFLMHHYNKVNEDNIKYVINFIKLIGYYKFFKYELDYRLKVSQSSNLNYLIKYFMMNVLTQQEKLQIKVQYMLKQLKNKKNGKNYQNKKKNPK